MLRHRFLEECLRVLGRLRHSRARLPFQEEYRHCLALHLHRARHPRRVEARRRQAAVQHPQVEGQHLLVERASPARQELSK